MNDHDSNKHPAHPSDFSDNTKPGDDTGRTPRGTDPESELEAIGRDVLYAIGSKKSETEGTQAPSQSTRLTDEEMSAAWQVLGGAPQEARQESLEEYKSPEPDHVEPYHNWEEDQQGDSGTGELFDDYEAPDDEETAEPAYSEPLPEPEPEPEPEAFEPPGVAHKETGDDGRGLPIGLIAVAVVALLLLAAGGYGVLQQRGEAQEEIRRLQAELATAASPAEVAAVRETLREMEQREEENLAEIEVLTLYNERLTDTVAGLEAQLAAQQTLPKEAEPLAAEPVQDTAPAQTPPQTAAQSTAQTPAQTPAPTAEPAPGVASSSAIAQGNWFVNFASYGQRSAAENWAAKLKPAAGSTTVLPTTSGGNTLYRVRVVGLENRAQAQQVASKLQAEYGLPPLWIGAD